MRSAVDKSRRFIERAAHDYYKGAATTVDYPDVDAEPSDTVAWSAPPRSIRHSGKDKIRDVSLQEVIRTALANGRVLKDNIQFLSQVNVLLTAPNQVRSVYDPALQESGVLFGQRGVEAALADFDARFTTNDSNASFGFDYSESGIPPAPNGNDTIGLVMAVNIVDPAEAAEIAVVHVDDEFNGQYTFTVDIWNNWHLHEIDNPTKVGTTEFRFLVPKLYLECGRRKAPTRS